MRKVITRRFLAVVALTGVILSLVAAVIAPDPNGAVQSFDTLFYISTALEVLSWVAAPIPAWFVARRVYTFHRAPASFQLLLWQYIVALTVLALLCEAPYDYARSGQWWDYSSQNPLWGVLIALVACSVWNIGSYALSAQAATRLVVVIAVLVWCFAFRVLISVVIFSLIFLLWSSDKVIVWRALRLNRHIATMMCAVATGITPLGGVWLIEHVSHHKKNQGSQWILWWSYPLLLALAAAIRLGIDAWLH